MFERKTTVPLFPTTLWMFKISDDVSRRVNTDIENLLDRLIAASPAKSKRFLQTAHDLHTLPEMQEITGYFMNAVAEVIDRLATKHKDMEITGCWGNIHPSSHSHREHSHSNNFLSAAYYVSVPPGGDEIIFHDPRVQPYVFFPAVEQLNEFTSERMIVRVVEGLLLLFPSWLVHSVPAGSSDERRISIAFNVNFTDFSSRISRPLWEGNVPTHPRST